MSELKLSKHIEELIQKEDEQIPQALFPEIYEIKNLKVSKALPLLKFSNLQFTQTAINKKIDIDVIVPSVTRPVDLLLFINQKKYDMFYKATEGFYIFKNVDLESSENIIEIFYRIGKKRSSSIYSIVKKKKSGKHNEKIAKHKRKIFV
ncbi:MAG: hypothetical protein M1480_05430 [Bacteroidetes bacterium]|nr:hypothetical protein [Bacteroidota bacterium]